jgi:pimeloyl-ACP methyl ester carboxylesterase
MVLELLDSLGLARVHVAGHDFGGPVALTLYHLAPQRILSLALANTNAFTDTPIPLPLQIARVRGVGEAAFRVLFGHAGLRLLWHAAVGDKAAFPKARYAEALRWERGRYWTRQLLLGSLRNLRRVYADVERTLSAISVPTAILWGLSDPFFSAQVGRRLADAIPGARFVPLAGCGHFVPEERPDATAIAIRQLARSTKP